MEDAAQRLHVFERARGAKLDSQAAAFLVVGACQHLRDAGHRAILERPRQVLDPVGVAGHERLLDLLACRSSPPRASAYC